MDVNKIIKEEIISYINEIGDASAKPLPYKLVNANPKEAHYIIHSKKQPIKLGLYLHPNNMLDVSFSANDEGDFASTNMGEQYRILSTIVKIVKKVLLDMKNKNNPIDKIGFEGKAEKGPDDQRRNEFYLRYIKNFFPDAHVSYHDGVETNRIHVDLPN